MSGKLEDSKFQKVALLWVDGNNNVRM